MPAISLKYPDLQGNGPTVDVRLAPSTSIAKGKRLSGRTVPLTALIDTGASTTVLKQGLPRYIGIRPTSSTYAHTASSRNVLCEEFAISLILPQGFKIRTTALELPLHSQGIDCLIGRDVLARCVMTYVGVENQVILSF